MFWIGFMVGLLTSLIVAIPTLTAVMLWSLINRKITKFLKGFCVNEKKK